MTQQVPNIIDFLVEQIREDFESVNAYRREHQLTEFEIEKALEDPQVQCVLQLMRNQIRKHYIVRTEPLGADVLVTWSNNKTCKVNDSTPVMAGTVGDPVYPRPDTSIPLFGG